MLIKPTADRELRHIWNMTGGGVDRNLAGDFFYYGGNVGRHRITAIVVNDLGMFDKADLDIVVTEP